MNEKRMTEGSVSFNILSVEQKHEIDFSPHPDATSPSQVGKANYRAEKDRGKNADGIVGLHRVHRRLHRKEYAVFAYTHRILLITNFQSHQSLPISSQFPRCKV